MSPIELDGDNLGRKHRHYNTLLKQAITKQAAKSSVELRENEDIENLLRIEAACINKNVEFILEVLKCDDMLYVSRAIKRSSWLITEPSCAHIINIDYLKVHQFPNMSTKAINKFVLSMRLNIKDEKRAESFFDYEEKRNVSMAVKWLPSCSLPFIEQAVAKHKDFMTKDLLKRLCQRSISALEIYIKKMRYFDNHILSSTLFLMNDAEKYLDLIGTLDSYSIPHFGRKYTKILMKICPKKIIDNFENFWYCIDSSICAKHMNKEDIKPFLLKQAANNNMTNFLKYDNVKHFLHHMPRVERFEFIKQIFLNVDNVDKNKIELFCTESACVATTAKHIYNWYRFAPFDVAFRDLKKLIPTESSPDERHSMLIILAYCAGSNIKNIQILIKYYYERHINEPFKFKIKFMEKVLKNFNVIQQSEIWVILNRLFHSMEVYVESSNNVQKCIEVIIIYNVVHNEPNSKLIEDKFSFNTLKAYKRYLQPDEQEKVFKYLYTHLQDKVNNKNITSQKCLNEVVEMIKICFDLLNDWEKKLNDYPTIIGKIKELITIKQEKSWNSNFSPLYHVNKKWRKYMFEESVVLWPSETVCINALKHDPSLLLRNEAETHKLCCNDSVCLSNFLKKLRLYWPLSLTVEWTDFYLHQLDNSIKHKAATKALIIILSPTQLKDLIKKYVPDDNKINWGDTDEHNLSLKKNIARKMYLSRPSIPTELVLMYARGDYLQYTVPSLCSVLSNLSNSESVPIIQKLLSAPVSLQKYGIRLAFSKLETKELKPLLFEVWKSTTNSTIRTILFEITHSVLCRKTNCGLSEELWILLSGFIDNLSHKENKKIYKLLGEIKNVPFSIRGKFYMKSYAFLRLMPSDDYIEYLLENLITMVKHSNIIDQLDTEFIVGVMLKGIDETFDKSRCKFDTVITKKILFCNDKETQTKRYEKILAPLMDRYLPLWDLKHDNQKYVQYNMELLTESFISNLKYVFLDPNKISPFKLFKDILKKIESSLLVTENYVFITTWKLATGLIELLNTYRPLQFVDEDTSDDIDTDLSDIQEEKWSEIIKVIVPSFAKICTSNLKIDVDKYFPTIYLLYGEAVQNIITKLDEYYPEYLLFKHMLTIDKSNAIYLLVINFCSLYPNYKQKPILDEIRKLLVAHKSEEIKMHYFYKFGALDTRDI